MHARSPPDAAPRGTARGRGARTGAVRRTRIPILFLALMTSVGLSVAAIAASLGSGADGTASPDPAPGTIATTAPAPLAAGALLPGSPPPGQGASSLPSEPASTSAGEGPLVVAPPPGSGLAPDPVTPSASPVGSVSGELDPHYYVYFTANVLGEVDPCG